jgi:hypothetical protein
MQVILFSSPTAAAAFLAAAPNVRAQASPINQFLKRNNMAILLFAVSLTVAKTSGCVAVPLFSFATQNLPSKAVIRSSPCDGSRFGFQPLPSYEGLV